MVERSAADLAYTTILEAILSGEYAPGVMLAETTLGAELGVSRTPIRSALTRLQDEGWITIYPKRGALVRGMTDREIADLIDARLILESVSVRRADRAVLSVLAARLENEVELHREHLARRDLRSFIESTIAFHRSFVQAAGNSVLLEFNDRLTNRQRFLIFRYGDSYLARANEIIAEHQALIDAVRSGGGPEFAEALRVHLKGTYGTPLEAICTDLRFTS
ncbi:MAG: GntR family transcriptional regulator [Propionicimonas sp.]